MMLFFALVSMGAVTFIVCAVRVALIGKVELALFVGGIGLCFVALLFYMLTATDNESTF